MPKCRSVSYRDAVEYSVAEEGTEGPFFVLGVRKSGSSILNSMVQAMAELNGLTFIDVAGKLFEAGIPVVQWQSDAALAAILAPGNVFGGFRNAPKAFYGSPLFRKSKKVLMVRDPRDALVSEYFSNAYSHSIPKEGDGREGMLALRETALQKTIDDYVIDMSRSFKRVLREYMNIAREKSCRLFRYEDVILEKGVLIDEICRHFDWTLTDAQRTAILGWADVLPTEEVPTAFIRRVTPGDHREKLSPDVIERLDVLFADEMKHYGYA